MLFISFLALGLLPSAFAAPSALVKRDYPGSGPCSGQCQGDLHDPSVVYDGKGTYYRFVTGNNIQVATAPSISGPWTSKGAALPKGSSIQLQGGGGALWAPGVHSFNGKYYMYYCKSIFGTQNSDIGLATSPSMAVGTWTDHGSVGIPANSKYNRIDPNLFYSGSGNQWYLSFGSYWHGIFQTTATGSSPPTKFTSSNLQNLAYNSSRRASGPSDPTEGSYQFQWNGYHYLFFSEGTVPSGGRVVPDSEAYRVMVCRSKSVTGPFVDQRGRNCAMQNGGTLVLASGAKNDVYAPGGQGVFYDPGQKSPVIYYHYSRPSVGYKGNQFNFGWNKLNFSSGWPVVVVF